MAEPRRTMAPKIAALSLEEIAQGYIGRFRDLYRRHAAYPGC